MTDPHWIRPGWVLLMPDDATLTPETAPPAPAAVAAPPRTAPAPAPAPQVRPSSPAPSTPPSSTADATPPPSPAARAPEPTAPGNPATATGQDQVPSLLTLLGAGLLAAGIGTVLARARVVQRRHRPTGSPMPRPSAALLHAESQLRVLAEPDDRDFLDTALRSLTVLTGGAPGRRAAATRGCPRCSAPG